MNYLGGAQPTFTFNFSRASAMIQAQYYLFVRLGFSGYKAIVGNMMANARYLNEQLEATGRFEILNPRLAEPVVTFRLKEGAAFDEYHLADRLRMNGWIVPAYTLPPDAEHVRILRVVVRNDFSRDKADMLLRQHRRGVHVPRPGRPAGHAQAHRGPREAAPPLLGRSDPTLPRPTRGLRDDRRIWQVTAGQPSRLRRAWESCSLRPREAARSRHRPVLTPTG